MTDIAKLKAAAGVLLNATEISNQLRHLADNEIDSDSFAVVTENYNGREVEFERPITDLALDAAGVIDELIAQNDALVAAHVNLKLLADVYRQAYEEALEHYKPREARVTKLVLDNERSWEMLCEKLEAAKKQNALDVQIKARLCRESNSLHDRVREAEKRIAELEARTVTVELPRGYAGPYGSMVYDAGAVEAALELAGINLETGGE